MYRMTQHESIAYYGPIHGPCASLPEDYVPAVLISDEQFDAICAKRDRGEEVTAKDRFFGRDYVVDQLHRNTKKVYLDGYNSLTEVLADMPNERLANLFWGLKSCSCCWRHCHNRPVAFDSPEDESALDRVTVEMVSERDCKCHCRSAKRFIRKAFLSKKTFPVSPLEWEMEE
jgi:hypothetical protein